MWMCLTRKAVILASDQRSLTLPNVTVAANARQGSTWTIQPAALVVILPASLWRSPRSCAAFGERTIDQAADLADTSWQAFR